jgi:hypothetical protein
VTQLIQAQLNPFQQQVNSLQNLVSPFSQQIADLQGQNLGGLTVNQPGGGLPPTLQVGNTIFSGNPSDVFFG